MVWSPGKRRGLPVLCGSQSTFILNFPPNSLLGPPTGFSSCHFRQSLSLSYFRQPALPSNISWGKNLSYPEEPLCAHCLLHDPPYTALARPSAQWILPVALVLPQSGWPLLQFAQPTLTLSKSWQSLGFSSIHALVHFYFNYCGPVVYFNYLVELVIDLMLDFLFNILQD